MILQNASTDMNSSKDKYREMDCRAKSRVVEMFEKTNRFGKCLTTRRKKSITLN